MLAEVAAESDRWKVVLGGSTVHFGAGSICEIAAIVANLGGRRPLIVTDAGVAATGRVHAVAAALAAAGIEPTIFAGVRENPTSTDVAAAAAIGAKHRVDLLIGLGGGSSMDTAKGVNFVLSNGGRIDQFCGDGKAVGPMLPSIGVPTTAGTGSEAQRFALISRDHDGRKMACGDRKARFASVILDPDLTATVPRAVRVSSGIDALTHAIESHVSSSASPVSRLYSREAWRLLSRGFEASLSETADIDTRSQMLIGAHLAGAAIESSMLGAAHACANPLTAQIGITHGIAVGILLPHVVRFNGAACAAEYAELSAVTTSPATPLDVAVEKVLAAARVRPRLRDHGVDFERLPILAADAATEWTANFNPRPVGAAELREIYEAAF